MGVPNTTCFFLNTWQPIQRGSSGLENHGWFIPQRAPHLSTGCVWYCSSVPFTSVKLSHKSRHKPRSNVVLFLSKSSHVFFNPLNPNEGTTPPMFLLFVYLNLQPSVLGSSIRSCLKKVDRTHSLISALAYDIHCVLLFRSSDFSLTIFVL